MKTMNDFIQAIRNRKPGMKDAELARTIGISRQALSQIKGGRSKHFSDETAFNIAEVLGLDPAHVLLCLAAERSTDPRVKRTWENIRCSQTGAMMPTMADFLSRLQKSHGVSSDYKLAKLLGLTRQTISAHKSGRAKHFSDETAYRLAVLLNEDPAYVLTCLAFERSSDTEVRKTWQRVARILKQAANL